MRSKLFRVLAVCALFVLPIMLEAISISTTTPAIQNFDSMGIPASTTTATPLPADFRLDTLATVRTVGTFAAASTSTARAGGANLSTSAANGSYNFGAGTAALGNGDRAVGFLSSGTATASGNLYGQFTNTTGAALTGVTVSYNVEKYRRGLNGAGFRIQLFYSSDGSTWTSAGADFLTSFPADADNSGFTTVPGATAAVTNKTITLAIPNGGSVYLAWNYSVAATSTTTNAQALAIDDISVTGGAGTVIDNPPSVTTTSPADTATNVIVSANIVINFSETVTTTANAFALECPAGTAKAFTQSGSGSSTITLDPTGNLPGGITCAVTVFASQITDTDGQPDHMAADKTFSFTTASPSDTAPSVSSTSPAGSATNVPVDSTIVINFSESVSATDTAFTIQCPTGSFQTLSQSASPATSITLTPSSPLPYSTTCTVGVSASQISDTDINDPPDTLASDFSFSFTTGAAPPPGAGKVIINEIDADTPGSDIAEFIELYDGGVGNTPLDGLVAVLYNGTDPDTLQNNDKRSYAAFDLDGYRTDASGYFVLGNPAVASAQLLFDPGQFGLLQNGPDAVALYIGSASDFPANTNVTTANLLDAIVYGTNDPSPSGLLPLTPNQLIVNEDANGAGVTESSQRCPNGMGGIRNNVAYRQAAPTPGAANGCPANRPPSDVVISQLYGGGGNANASFHNDYIELFNRSTTTAVDLSGWSVQYASSTGNGWSGNLQPLGGTIGPLEYYLIALGTGGGGGANLPPANVTGQINMSGTTGKVALVDSFDPLVGNCPIFNGHVRDFVGYGAADCGEGSVTAPSLAGNNGLSLLRQGNGATDTDHNSPDFTTGAPSPRRTAAIVELGPFVLLTDPRNGATHAPRDATIQVTFTEAVDVFDPWFDIACSVTGHHTDATQTTFPGSGRDHYITPNVNFQAGETCTVTVVAGQVHDQDLDDSAPNTDTLRANYVFSFTVADGTAPAYPSSVHLTFGNPSDAGSDPLDYLMEKPEFALSYNRDMGRPNWVSWHLSDEWIGTLTREDTFRPDPAIPADWYRVQSFDFVGSGFDRGHMTPNADRDKETSIPINQATFLMSNMVAQAPANNQGPWAAMEGDLRTIVDQGNELYIVAGPQGMGGTGSNGGVTNTLADGHVTVPAWTWKVALVLPKDGGDDLSRVTCTTRTIAVILPNVQTVNSDWHSYLTTVDAVETLTGFDILSNLPEPIQGCVEARKDGDPALPLVPGTQTITFAVLPGHVYGDAPFTVSATGGKSGQPVTFTAFGACMSEGVNGATITVTAAGLCTVTASQAGTSIYEAAPPVSRSFNVAKADPVFTALSSPSIEAGTAAVSIGGVINAGGFVPTGSVTISVGGHSVSAPIGAGGLFTGSLPTAALSPAGSPYAIAFSYAGDANFNGVTGSGTLTVVDTTAPSITGVGATPDTLGPPNHKMINVTVGYQASDVTGAPVCSLSVSSSEPVNGSGDGNTSVDWQVVDAHHVQLRAERAGSGNGRTYTIAISCRDASGNSSSAAATVRVPK